MPKRVKGVVPRNPLAVIASLIGVVEVAFAYPVTRLSGINQTIIVVFLVAFPVLLVVCFFVTVWFKPGHLYSPKDYSTDESFLVGIRKVQPTLSRRPREQFVGQPTALHEDVSRPVESGEEAP